MMRRLLYTGLLLAANGAFAGTVDPALLTGAMAKLVIEDARGLPTEGLVDRAEVPQSLEVYKGRWVLVNFWATWCVPCRTEMPALDRLSTEMPQVAVVTVAVGPNPLPAIDKFLADAGVTHVVVWRDPTTRFAAQIGVLGLPVTVVVNPAGLEVARLLGGAEWDSAGAQAVLKALMAP